MNTLTPHELEFRVKLLEHLSKQSTPTLMPLTYITRRYQGDGKSDWIRKQLERMVENDMLVLETVKVRSSTKHLYSLPTDEGDPLLL